MPKKKQPFICFCESMRDLSENRGLSLPELVTKYGEAWKNLSQEERRPYEDCSKNYSRRPPAFRLSQSVGTDAFDDVGAEATLHEDFLKQLTEAAIYGVEDIDELKAKSFFLASFNIMCINEEGDYLANELGIVEYSIKDGIIDCLHHFIDPGDIPVGYAWKAKQHSEATHKIPPLNFAHGLGNERLPNSNSRDLEKRRQAFSTLVDDILKYIEKSRLDNPVCGKNPMIVFCKPDQIAQVKGSLKFLWKVSKKVEPSYKEVEVLNVVWLLTYLCDKIGIARPYAACEGDLNLCTFDYSPNTNCAYHDEIDVPHCAVGVPKRWCYMLSDVLCKLYEIQPTENHMPVQVNSDYFVQEFVPREASFNFKPMARTWDSEVSGKTYVPPTLVPVRAPREAPPMKTDPLKSTMKIEPSLKSTTDGNNVVRSLGIGRGRGIRRPQ